MMKQTPSNNELFQKIKVQHNNIEVYLGNQTWSGYQFACMKIKRCTCQKMKCSLMTVLMALLDHTSRFRI